MRVRFPTFNFTENDPFYYRFSNLYRNYLLATMHVQFPEGESYLIRVTQTVAKNIKDVQLKDQVKKFIGQEMQHSKAHESIHEILMKQGFSIEKSLAWYTKLIPYVETLCNKIFPNNKLNIAVAAAVEHYTAITSEFHLKYIESVDKQIGTPFEMCRLMVWHACEEIEHKSVIFDVMKANSTSYFIRILGLLIASFLFMGVTTYLMIVFLKEDPIRKKTPTKERWKQFMDYNRYSKYFYGLSFIRFWQYFKPNFHPSQIKENIDINHFLKEYKL